MSASGMAPRVWVGERLLLAAWLGDLVIENSTASLGEDVEIRMQGRTLSESEARLFVDLLQAGALLLTAESVGLTEEGFALLQRWSRYVPRGVRHECPDDDYRAGPAPGR